MNSQSKMELPNDVIVSADWNKYVRLRGRTYIHSSTHADPMSTRRAISRTAHL